MIYTSTETIKYLNNSISKCLLCYSTYLGQLLQSNLQDHYGWHNRIWTIYDVELPALITRLVNLLDLNSKLLFATLNSTTIRLTDVLFSINLHADTWRIAFNNMLENIEVNTCLWNIEKANEEMQGALSNIFMRPK